MERTQFRFTVGGQDYKYLGYLGAADALLIKQHAGLSLMGFLGGVMTADPAALVALVFLAKRQAGERVTWDEVVTQLDGEDDLMALVETLRPIEDGDKRPAEKARKRTPKTEPVEEPEPAAV